MPDQRPHTIPSPLRLLLLATGLAVLLASALPAAAADKEQYKLEHQKSPHENLLSLIFGSPPPMATERGILLIDAYLDQNGNGVRDAGETDLAGKLSCTLDGIEYLIPAFIPGLKYEGSYQLACASDGYRFDLTKPDLFIAQRGEILRVDIPCKRKEATKTAVKSDRPSTSHP